MSSSRRLMHELKAIHAEKNNDEVLLTCVDETGLLDWRASIRGPPDTPYADIYFELIISVPTDYPLKPPVVSFATKVFHPNVHFKVRSFGTQQPQLSHPDFCLQYSSSPDANLVLLIYRLERYV